MADEPKTESAVADPAQADPIVIAVNESVPTAPAEAPAADAPAEAPADPPADAPADPPADPPAEAAPSFAAEVEADVKPVVVAVEKLVQEAEVAGAKVVAHVQAAAPVVADEIVGKLEAAFPQHAGMIAAMKRWFRDELALYHNGKNNIEREEGNP